MRNCLMLLYFIVHLNCSSQVSFAVGEVLQFVIYIYLQIILHF